MTASPFPDSRPFSELIEESRPFAGYTVSGPPGSQVTFTSMGLTQVWLLARMPDGLCAEGRGRTDAEAMADARRNWRRWKRAHAGPLAVDGRQYQRRLKARRRRR